MRSMKNKRLLFGLMVLFMFCAMLPVVHAQSDPPFSIEVEPEKTTANAGDEVPYKISIIADAGFEGDIIIVLEIEALSYYYESYDLGVVGPPFPTEFEYLIPVPSDVPADVTAYGTLTGTSGDYVVDAEVELVIKSGTAVGGIVGWILNLLNNIWKAITGIFN
jgi:hypothetical protein